jgi:hypothetical protein
MSRRRLHAQIMKGFFSHISSQEELTRCTRAFLTGVCRVYNTEKHIPVRKRLVIVPIYRGGAVHPASTMEQTFCGILGEEKQASALTVQSSALIVHLYVQSDELNPYTNVYPILFPEMCCNSCAQASLRLKTCNACESAFYCNVDCQGAHRKAHRRECKRIAAELERDIA